MSKLTQLFHVELDLHREIRLAMKKSVVSLQQIAIGPDSQLYALDIKGRIWVWARAQKEWYMMDQPLEDEDDIKPPSHFLEAQDANESGV